MPLWCFSVLSSRFFFNLPGTLPKKFFLSHHSTNGNWYNLFIKTIRYRHLWSDSLAHRLLAGILPALAVTHSFVLWLVSRAFTAIYLEIRSWVCRDAPPLRRFLLHRQCCIAVLLCCVAVFCYSGSPFCWFNWFNRISWFSFLGSMHPHQTIRPGSLWVWRWSGDLRCVCVRDVNEATVSVGLQ